MTQNASDIARAILAAHSARFDGHPAAAFDGFSSDAPVYRGAREACARLGFIAIDSECVARAWQAQTERLGHFDAAQWPADPRDFGLGSFPPAARANSFPPCPIALGLYAVLPDAAWVGRMARAGVPTVQLRFKSDDPAAIAREVQAAVEAVRGTSALLFINDHWQLAIEAGAYGVHLGQEDLDALTPAEVQQLRASGLRLGVSTHGYAEMVRADAVSPSYLALGAVFPTTLKKMATAPQGLARLHGYADLMRGYPLVAIGGIDMDRLPQALAAGVGSIAVVRAIVGADDPEGAARALMARMQQGMR
ncbi:thiamine phosphate synthase [Xenophilus arseniciresistens]|uniref:Thiamine-phosphate synthase n=1 Tax=Xenophilus arseniciresistens TaxID=1283306 RepID=A0AAE3N684_9BURK|nr:thiamine phosphate synthase [Xenophilus arseniciresistens]MDA7415318.1 thiamine phosphate synthase [Xenophilus arseniciresistens]